MSIDAIYPTNIDPYVVVGLSSKLVARCSGETLAAKISMVSAGFALPDALGFEAVRLRRLRQVVPARFAQDPARAVAQRCFFLSPDLPRLGYFKGEIVSRTEVAFYFYGRSRVPIKITLSALLSHKGWLEKFLYFLNFFISNVFKKFT
jgi:hypothetical protein